MSPTLLVSGASGLLGHAILERAVGVFDCVGLDVTPAPEPIHGVQYETADLRDEAGLRRAFAAHVVTHVVHAGAISGPMLLRDAPATVVAINLGGTQNVLEASRVAGVQRLVFLSSASVYGVNAPDALVGEDSAKKPTSIYGASKAAAEALVLGYHTCFGLESVILRPVNIYGPRRRTESLISYVVANALDGMASHITVGVNAADFIHVDDVARSALLALESPSANGNAYTIGTGAPVPYAHVADVVRRLLPHAHIELESAPDGGAEGRYDVRAAARDLQFEPAWDLERGLRQTIDVMRERSDLREAARAAWTATHVS